MTTGIGRSGTARRVTLVAISVLGAVSLSGCMAHKPHYVGELREVAFQSEPAGATAVASFGESCTTPCKLVVGAKYEFSVTFQHPGYRSQTVAVKPEPNDARKAMLALTTVLGGLSALAASASNGGYLEHVPNPVNVVLERAGSSSKMSPKGKQKVAPAPAPVTAEPKPADES